MYSYLLLFSILCQNVWIIKIRIVHNYIHIYAFNHNNYLLEHHLIHHKYKKYNLCVLLHGQTIYLKLYI